MGSARSTRSVLALLCGLVLCLVGCTSGRGPTDPVEAGKATAASAGCVACHGVDGQGGVGPAWRGLAGSKVTLTDGSEVVADDDYLRRAIQVPAAQQVKGFSTAMPRTDLSREEIDDLVAYIRSLR